MGSALLREGASGSLVMLQTTLTLYHPARNFPSTATQHNNKDKGEREMVTHTGVSNAYIHPLALTIH